MTNAGSWSADRFATVFQPVVHLDSGSVVAYEALTRAWAGEDSLPIADLFAEAHRDGTARALDETCARLARRTAAEQGLDAAHALFLNLEPATLAASDDPESLRGPRVVVEVTERALTSEPGALIRSTERIRAAGHRIAVDDLGAQPASLALLPLLEPDVIKLDMGLIRGRPDRDAARIMTVVAGYAESGRSIVLAEGVETERQLVTARALGATHAQGWLFGRPEAEIGPVAAGVPFATDPPQPSGTDTPFEIVAENTPLRFADRALLVQLSRFLEDRAEEGGDSAVLLTTFQAGDNLIPSTRSRYERLAAGGALVTVFTQGPAPELASAITHRDIPLGDPLAEEWDVVLLTADYAAALVARERDPGQHATGDYEFALTTDRALVKATAVALLTR
ncbi:EAL domain-containing protein [Herbiconiux solani]|uniref:EAL domain-containing protein n=1 Tax=Herbiconiux solani TaxID=661329 RepID=UPI000826C215|nr:EAL domain-containing protein [Herbiconiux solani]